MKILIDTNVIIDYLQCRPQFLENAEKIFDLVYSKKIDGVIAAHSITNIWYITKKTFDEETRRKLLLSILETFEISGIFQKNLTAALLRDDFSDFEDCVQDECAAAAEADYIVTRNKDDFGSSKVPALTPEEFVKKYA